MKKQLRLITTVLAFLLLFPFRLPISVLLVYAFNSIAQLAGKVVPDNVLCANVVITKLVYNLALGVYFIYGVEKISRSLLGRKALEIGGGSSASTMSTYWWTLTLGILTGAYIIYDCAASTELFWSVIGKPIYPNY